MPERKRSLVFWVVAVAALILAATQVPFSSAVVSTLFGICAITVALRLVPADRIPEPIAAVSDLIGGVAAAVLFATHSDTGIATLLYVTAVYVGARHPQRVSIPIAALMGIVTIVCAGIREPYIWWMGVSIALSVWAGMAGRIRRERTRALEQLVEQTRRTAQSEARSSALAERTRIARDLHDVLAHTLSGAGMQLELADGLLEARRPDDAREAVLRARTAIAEGVVEARNAVHALREDTVHLGDALAAMTDGPHEHVSVEATTLSDDRTRAVLRIAQEAITNARRHSPGGDLTLSLRATAVGPELLVTNGRGTRRGQTSGSGMGLIGMRERAQEVGGELHAGPTDDGGWSVRLTMKEEPS